MSSANQSLGTALTRTYTARPGCPSRSSAAARATIARASTLASAGTASSRSSTTPSGPDRGSLASTSARLPGANNNDRMRTPASVRAAW